MKCSVIRKAFDSLKTLWLVASVMLSGCFSIPLGTYETELPSSATHLPKEIVGVKRFDGFNMSARGSFASVELHFSARGKFVVKREPKRIFEVPKRCAIGLCPGFAVPAPSMLSRTPYKPLVMYCMFWTVVDALFIEPFSGYEPDLNVNNLAQFSFLGCCKYNDIENSQVISEIPWGEEAIEEDEWLLDDCLVSVAMGTGFGMTNDLKLPVKNGVTWLNTLGTNAAGGGQEVVIPVRFDTLPPVGGDLGGIIKEQLLGRTFQLRVEENR